MPTCADSFPFADQIRNLAIWHSKRLVRIMSVPAYDREDIQQDLHLALWLSCEQIDPKLGTPQAFLNQVAANEVKSVLSRRRAARRDHRRCMVLDEAALCPDRRSNGREERLLMRMDVRRAVAALPPELRRTAIELQNFSQAETARRLKVCRDTIYRRIKSIRNHLGRGQLDRYLQ
jgi:RNA polymerase sigma factor (sigma-70 family)